MRAKHAARIHLGTSGWWYAYWRRPFYPVDLPQKHWLAFCAARCPTAEINNSFHQLPDRRTLASRAQCAATIPVRGRGEPFRCITHMKKLKDPKTGTRAFVRRIAELGDRLRMRFDIGQARRGWLEPGDVINALKLMHLKKLLNRR